MYHAVTDTAEAIATRVFFGTQQQSLRSIPGEENAVQELSEAVSKRPRARLPKTKDCVGHGRGLISRGQSPVTGLFLRRPINNVGDRILTSASETNVSRDVGTCPVGGLILLKRDAIEECRSRESSHAARRTSSDCWCTDRGERRTGLWRQSWSEKGGSTVDGRGEIDATVVGPTLEAQGDCFPHIVLARGGRCGTTGTSKQAM